MPAGGPPRAAPQQAPLSDKVRHGTPGDAAAPDAVAANDTGPGFCFGPRSNTSMMRRIRRPRAARMTAVLVTAALLWMFGPYQVAHAAASWANSEMQKRAGKARRLSPEAMRAIRGGLAINGSFSGGPQ